MKSRVRKALLASTSRNTLICCMAWRDAVEARAKRAAAVAEAAAEALAKAEAKGRA